MSEHGIMVSASEDFTMRSHEQAGAIRWNGSVLEQHWTWREEGRRGTEVYGGVMSEWRPVPQKDTAP